MRALKFRDLSLFSRSEVRIGMIIVPPFCFAIIATLLINSKTSSEVPLPLSLQCQSQLDNPTPLQLKDQASKAKPCSHKEALTKNEVLSDVFKKISPQFRVPVDLVKRTSFWFDFYTKYDSDTYVFHHSKYPWVIFDIVTTHNIQNSNLHKWTKYHKIRRLLRKKKFVLLKTLRRLSRKKSFKKLTAYEEQLLSALSPLKGSIKSRLRFSVKRVRMQRGQKDFFQAALRRSNDFLPFMENEFKRLGLPHELTRIPFVESSFDINAFSKVGAAGIWQIMPKTAQNKLKMTRSIDERMSPFKATTMAAKHLKRDRRLLKSWGLAITSYNNGIGNTRRALKHHRVKTVAGLINRANTHGFGFASKNFYACFLAALHAQKYRVEFLNQPLEHRPAPSDVARLRLKKAIKISTLLKKLNISAELFFKFNLDIRRPKKNHLRLSRGFVLFLPRTHLKFGMYPALSEYFYALKTKGQVEPSKG